MTLASFYLLSPVLLPIIIAFTLYALFEPAVLHLLQYNMNHSIAILIVLVLLLIGSFLAIGLPCLPWLTDQFVTNQVACYRRPVTTVDANLRGKFTPDWV